MRKALGVLAILSLAACSASRDFHAEEQSKRARQAEIIATAPHPNFVGTPEWYEWVNRWTGVVDAEGHGPDPGSVEWCHAVNYKVTGFFSDDSMVCDRKWERRIDNILRSTDGWFGLVPGN